MLVEVDKQQLCMNQLIAKKIDMAKIEGDVIVNDVKPDVLSIINTSGIVCIYKKEIMNGKVKIDGGINTYIMYLADDEDGSIRSLNTVLDFTQIIEIDKCKEDMQVNVDVKLKNIESKIINGRKINVNAMIEICSMVYTNENIDIINGINENDVQILNENISLNSLVGEGKNTVYAKDTILLNESDDLAEIMKVEFTILNKDAKISYNKVITKADAQISIMYLTEDNRVDTVTARIPVMGFVDIENITDESICDIRYTLKNLIIKPNSGEEPNSIYVEAEIELECMAYETKEINLIKDLYSIDNDFDCKKKEFTTMIRKDIFKNSYKINEEIQIPEIGNNKIYDGTIAPNITKTNAEGNNISYEGDIVLKFIYQANDGIGLKEIKLPLMFSINVNNIGEIDNYSTEIEVIKDNFITEDNGKMHVDIELLFKVDVTTYKRINLINEIEKNDSQGNEDLYSMVIYFVKPGDTLWKIAKKFKTRVEDIARINNIEDTNKIHVGQQLYIPKYVKKSVAV